MSSKHATTEYNRFQRVRGAVGNAYSLTIAFQSTHTALLDKLTAIYNSADYKKLSNYYRGYIAGIVDSLSAEISRNYLAWCLGPSTGWTRNSAEPWNEEMSTLCRLPGQLYGGHFWTDDKGQPTQKAFNGYTCINEKGEA